MFKVERIPEVANPYEVMLSPFNTKEEVLQYYNKYSISYPEQERSYRVTNLNTNEIEII